MISKIDPSLTIEYLTTTPEGQFFDRKSERIATKDFAHHLSAFANASGGLIVLGIEDEGDITGVSAEKENDFRKVTLDYFQVLPELCIEVIPCTLKSGELGNIVLFHIAPSANEIIKLKTGEAYLRAGDSSRKLNTEQLVALEYSKGIKSFESRIIDKCTTKMLVDLTKRSRPTVLSHVKQLLDKDMIVEHSTSLRDPTKYYTIK